MSRFEFSRECSETIYSTIYFAVKARTEEEALELLENAPFEYEAMGVENNSTNFEWEYDFEFLNEKNEED